MLEEDIVIEETTSEPMDIDDFELLPDDYVEGDGEEETDEESDEEESEEVTEEEEKEETTIEALEDLEVKYLRDSKKLKDIPREEIKTFIQKGMNHDRVQEKLQIANEQNTEFTEIAKMFDMELKDLTETLKQQYFEGKADRENRNIEDVKKEYSASHKNSQQRAIDRFMTKFPDVKLDALPQEVVDDYARGEDLVTAYNNYNKGAELKTKETEISTLNDKIKTLEKELATHKQNAKTKAKGVVKATNGAGIEHDEFLEGLFS